MPTVKQVFDALRHITEPGHHADIVSRGQVHDLKIDAGRVFFKVRLSTDRGEVMEAVRGLCEQALEGIAGVETIEVAFEAHLPQPREAPTDVALGGVKHLIAISSCKGGVGKSTVAVLLAKALQRAGHAVGLLDADVYGPSAPSLLHCHHPEIEVGGQYFRPVDIDGLKVMSMGFVMGESPAIVRGPIVSRYVQQVLMQCQWGNLDYLIIDLPPGTGDIQLTLVQQVSLDGALIVTTPHMLSLVDVAKGILMFEKVSVPVLGIVENMCAFTPEDSDTTYYPFGRSEGSLQKRFGIETLAELPITQGMSDPLQPGPVVEGAFDALATAMIEAVAKSKEEQSAPPEVEVLPGAVRFVFNDGLVAAIPNHTLRCACPCAMCVDENSGERLLDPAQIPNTVAPEALMPLGNYAIVFEWSDGHTTGIYPWAYLRKLAEQQMTDSSAAP